MRERITEHFNKLFEEAPKTRKALDMKQEMLQNALDKYDDLMREEYSEEDAFEYVIRSIGDVTELFDELSEKPVFTPSETDRKKKAMLTAIAVGLYIFAGGVFFLFAILDGHISNYNGDFALIGLVAAIMVCIIPTVMLVYAANMYVVYPTKQNPDMVEIYKKEKFDNKKDKAVTGAIRTIIWSLTVVLYFVISFTTSDWHITWVIFLIGVCAQSIASLIISLKRQK